MLNTKHYIAKVLYLI